MHDRCKEIFELPLDQIPSLLQKTAQAGSERNTEQFQCLCIRLSKEVIAALTEASAEATKLNTSILRLNGAMTVMTAVLVVFGLIQIVLMFGS